MPSVQLASLGERVYLDINDGNLPCNLQGAYFEVLKTRGGLCDYQLVIDSMKETGPRETRFPFVKHVSRFQTDKQLCDF